MVKRILPFALIALILGGLLLWSQQQRELQRVSGVIEADEIRLGSRVGGRVKAVLVEEGSTVSEGEPLIELEPYDLRQRLAEAQAMAQQRREEYKIRTAGLRQVEIDQARARYERNLARVSRMERDALPEELAAARAQVELANAQLERAQQSQRQLKEAVARRPDVVTEEELNLAEEEVRVAQATVKVREEELKILAIGTREEERREARAQLAEALAALKQAEDFYREEEQAQAKAALDAAEAAVKVIERQIEELTISSSVSGVVEAMELQPGDLVAPGAPVISVLDTGRLWVRAYVPQGELDIELGQAMTVTVDAYPDRRFDAEVTFVSRQAEFTPSNVQTFEERAKQMFRIKVTLREIADEEIQLRPGMTADVWLNGR